jgi:hypothetical protein
MCATRMATLRDIAAPQHPPLAQILLEMGVRPMGIIVNGITNSRSYEYRYGQDGYQ